MLYKINLNCAFFGVNFTKTMFKGRRRDLIFKSGFKTHATVGPIPETAERIKTLQMDWV